MVYNPPFYRTQKGVMGHVLGGWSVAPLFTFHSGASLFVNNLNGNCQSFGEGSCAGVESDDGAVLNAPWTGGTSAHYNQTVAPSASSAGENTNYANGGDGINLFSNPAATFAQFRPCILGYDTSCGGGGQIRGMPYWNVDMTVSKDIAFWKEGRVGATLIFQFVNLFNTVQLSDPYLDISDPQDWGVLGAPNGGANFGGPLANNPRSMEFGLRIHW